MNAFKKFLSIAITLIAGSTSAKAQDCIDLNEATQVSALKQRLLSMKAGQAFEGVKQCDGNNFSFMKGWEFRRFVETSKPNQHILVFFNGVAEKAVGWVDEGGSSIAVPPRTADASQDLELAIDLSGEEYNEPTINPDGKIYVFRFMPKDW